MNKRREIRKQMTGPCPDLGRGRTGTGEEAPGQWLKLVSSPGRAERIQPKEPPKAKGQQER